MTPQPRKCKACGEVLEAWEHPAAKNCLKCRDPEAYAIKMLKATTIGDVVGPSPEEAKKEQEKPVPPPSLAKTVTPFFVNPGDEVSLNLKQRKFLILPKSGWELSPRKWSGIIPDPIDPVELKMLRICLEAGDLVKGRVFTGIEKDETTLHKAAQILQQSEIEMRLKIGLLVQHKGLIGGYQPYEILRYLIRFEDDNEHRRSVMDFIQSGLDFLGSSPPKSTPLVVKTIEQITGMKFQ
jgi:hypothetical protein